MGSDACNMGGETTTTWENNILLDIVNQFAEKHGKK